MSSRTGIWDLARHNVMLICCHAHACVRTAELHARLLHTCAYIQATRFLCLPRQHCAPARSCLSTHCKLVAFVNPKNIAQQVARILNGLPSGTVLAHLLMHILLARAHLQDKKFHAVYVTRYCSTADPRSAGSASGKAYSQPYAAQMLGVIVHDQP